FPAPSSKWIYRGTRIGGPLPALRVGPPLWYEGTMSSPSRLVTGFNHNVKHRGQLFHVQTEDTGPESGHIVTHLFIGGNIIASKKTSYAELRSAPNLASLVRTLMEEQHKEMLRNLVNGVYDAPMPPPEPEPPSRQPPAAPP